MKRSTATNTFNQGLLMDLNPMVTPNDVVTNCLNGTLITYNGNENVLQNDMGNGRVETAYLPEGYVPLGTAELGGIVYIVSYNPLTDKCQIGSFPSPERNITQDELPSSSVSIHNEQFQEGRKVLNTIVKVKLLTNSESEDGTYKLNPGDKFAIYSTNNGIENNRDTISDVLSTPKEQLEGEYPSNIKDIKGQHKIDAVPKFVTIHVVSIGEDGKITYLDDYLKWDNTKLDYYIKDCQGTEGVEKDLDEYRSLVSSAYNIFNSKVSGELALLFELKTIDSFSITWDTEVTDTEVTDTSGKNKNKEAKVTFDVNWTSGHSEINPTNIILSKSEPSTGFDVGDISVKQNDSCIITPEGNRTNDGLDDAVKVQVGTFKYSSEDTLSKYIWNYEVIPAMKFGELDYLAVKGTINFAEIGSGKIALDEWRYYIQENGIYLNWGLSAYPEKNKKIKKVTFTFIPFEQADSTIKTGENDEYPANKFPQYVVKDRNSYSGNFQEIINFGETSKIIGGTLDPNYLYLVDVCVKYGKSGSNTEDKNIHTYRWLYTTGQWNDKFLQEDITDFKYLTLEDTLKFESNFKATNTITPQVFINYPALNLDNDPGDGGEYSSMGIKTLAVNYDKNTKSFTTNEANVQLQIEVTPDKYSELFGFDDQATGVTYSNSISNRFITHSAINVSSDKTSGISDRVESKFMGPTESGAWNFPSNFGTTVDSAISKPITQDLNDSLKDSFDVGIISGVNSNRVDLCVRGALFSRINSDMVSKMMSIGQRVRPILYNSGDYDSLGFDANTGNLKFYFLEGHKDLGGGKPFCFKFGYRNLSEKTDVQAEQSTKKHWDPSDSFTRNTYWDNTPPYTDWLNPWMKAAQGPFQILQYGAYMGDVKFEGTQAKQLKNQYGLWVRTNNGHFMPINAFWTSGTLRSTISDSLKAVLMQIYYVETDVTPVAKFVVDNINVLDAYSETWNASIKSDLVVQNMDNAIKLKYSNTNISLANLQSKFSSVNKDGEDIVNINNIKYSKEEKQTGISAESGLFSHMFRVNMNDLYAIYETNKSTIIPAIYDISTKEGSEAGASVNANNLYVYKEGYGSQPGVMAKLSKQNSYNIKPGGTVTTKGDKLVLTPSGVGKSSLDICNMFILKDGELCFDEERLLANSVSFFYSTNEGARYKGNSKYEFITGTKYY